VLDERCRRRPSRRWWQPVSSQRRRRHRRHRRQQAPCQRLKPTHVASMAHRTAACHSAVASVPTTCYWLTVDQFDPGRHQRTNFVCLYVFDTQQCRPRHVLGLSVRRVRSFVRPYSGTSSSISDSPIPSPITSGSLLCSSITPSLFHSRLKTYLFHKSYSFPVVSLLPPGLPPRTFVRTVSSKLLGFCT